MAEAPMRPAARAPRAGAAACGSALRGSRCVARSSPSEATDLSARDHAGAEPVIRDYDFHPPDDVRLFPMPRAGILRFDDEVFVAQIRYGDVVVRHYAWREHWFEINCTTDRRGRLVETTAPDDVPPFTFNCDIATPMVRSDDAVFAVDLWLDVLVRGDGVTHGVYDGDEFDDAVARGWLSPREAAGARAGLDELVDLIERRALVDFLAEVHPFAPADVPEAPAMERVELSEAELLRPGARASW
jgi:hypothetical protein